MPDIMKPKRSTESIANVSDKVLEKDEMLVITPDAGSGKGKYKIKFGDGVTSTKNLPIAVDGEKADDMKVSALATPTDENPILSAGDTIKDLFGKTKKKFTYFENLVGNVKTVTNLFGSTDAKTVAQGLQNLVNNKLNKSDKSDAIDSNSNELYATPNAVRKVNEKTDINATAIDKLNSDLGERLPYTQGNAAVAMETNVDQSGNAHLKVSKGSLQTLLKFWPDQRITIEKYNGSSWSSSGELLGNADMSDSGWKNLTLTSDFKLYTNSSTRYRKIGKLVELRGVIAPTKSISADSLTVAFTLPSGYRPSSLVSEICQGSGSNRWLLSIEASGNAVVSRYGTTEYIAIPTTAWLPFHAVYCVE